MVTLAIPHPSYWQRITRNVVDTVDFLTQALHILMRRLKDYYQVTNPRDMGHFPLAQSAHPFFHGHIVNIFFTRAFTQHEALILLTPNEHIMLHGMLIEARLGHLTEDGLPRDDPSLTTNIFTIRGTLMSHINENVAAALFPPAEPHHLADDESQTFWAHFSEEDTQLRITTRRTRRTLR
jgi:hypothetical protein